MQPDGWEELSVGDVLSLMRNGFSCKQNKEGHGNPVTRIETISDGYIDFNKIGYAEIPIDQKEKYKLKSGDILFSHINSVQHIAKVACFQSDQELYHGMNLMLLRPDSALFLPEFAFYFFSSKITKRYFEHRCKKAINQASLNRKDIGGYEINLPPIDEQRKIADVLQSVDEAITATQDVIDQTRKVKQGLLHRLLTRGIGHTTFKQTDIGEIPESWEVVEFGNFATLQRGFDLPVQSRIKGNIPVIASNGIVGAHNGAKVEGPGVVTGRSGTIGKVLYFEDNFWPLNTTLYIKDFHGNDRKFVSYFIEHFNLQTYATGTGVPTLNRNNVHIVPIAKPPLQEQQEIVLVLDEAQSAIDSNKEKLEQLQTLKAGVMSDLLSGRVRVPLDNTMKEEAA